MTRKEEIEKASKEFACNKEYYFVFDVQDAFENGAKWADKHPDLSHIWHDAYEEPEIGSNIIVVDENGRWWDIKPYDGEYDGYGDLTGWKCCVVHYNNIQRWAYIDDLLPKTK